MKKLIAGIAMTAVIFSQTAFSSIISQTAYAQTAQETKEEVSSESGNSDAGENNAQDLSGASAEAIGEYLSGASSDIKVSSVTAKGGKAGGTLTISFTVSGSQNTKKKYQVDAVEQVYPVLDASFPFETNDEAYKVVSGTGNTLQCSYSFKVKESVDSTYYPVSFATVYTKKNIADGKGNYADKEYAVIKTVNVKLTEKATTEQPATTETAAEDGDITMLVKNSPSGTYGGNCTVNFRLKSKKSKILTVTPAVSEKFPFETSGDAYKTVRSKGTNQLDCSFHFKVRSDVATGYEPLTFNITYIKNKKKLNTTCTVNVKLTGKKEKKPSTGSGEKKKTSTPRVMVTGYDTDVEKIYPNKQFKLTFHIKNNAKTAVQNVKFTFSSGNGEFLPVSGASTAFRDSIPAGAVIDIPINMRSSASLTSRSYAMKIKAEYENADAEAFSSEDSISIPVSVKDRITITELEPPESISMGGSEDLSFSINNLGVTSLNNVTVSYKGEGISCEESFVGNIASGTTGYASLTLNGDEMTPEDSDGEGTILVSYENAGGESKTYKQKA